MYERTLHMMFVNARACTHQMFTYPEMGVTDTASDFKGLAVKAHNFINNISSTADIELNALSHMILSYNLFVYFVGESFISCRSDAKLMLMSICLKNLLNL